MIKNRVQNILKIVIFLFIIIIIGYFIFVYNQLGV